jgi:hypothetical protein
MVERAQRLRERFGVSEELVASYDVKRQLRDGRRRPFQRAREVV